MKTERNIPSRPAGGHASFRISPFEFCLRPAFTFIEVLFSVVILGIGLIMIAGMLPVAIKQNADTRNDLTAKVVCDSGYAYIRTLIQTHPEAFPETCGDRGADVPVSNLYLGGEPFAPKNNSMLDKFMGNELMNLNNDDYTPSGTSPVFNQQYQSLPVGGERVNRLDIGLLRAGRMMPLSYDVAFPDTTNSFNLSTMNAAALANYPLAWHQLNLGDRIVSSDPRFQWLAFYRRDEGSRVIKLVIVAMRQQTAEVTDRYDAAKTLPNEGIGDPQGQNPKSSNGPFLVPVEIEDCLTEPDKVKFVGTPGTDAWDVDVAETGSFLIIAHSPPKGGPQINGSGTNVTVTDNGDMNRPYRNNGKVFRLAARREDLDVKTSGGTGRVWELAPGFDLNPADAGADQIVGTPDDVPDGSMNPTQSFDDNQTPAARATAVAQYPISDTQNVGGTRAWAWIIGRGHLDPTTATGNYVGATQDLGILSVDVPMP